MDKKRLVTINIAINEDLDSFGIETKFSGFENDNPGILERMMVARILDKVKDSLEEDIEEIETKK